MRWKELSRTAASLRVKELFDDFGIRKPTILERKIRKQTTEDFVELTGLLRKYYDQAKMENKNRKDYLTDLCFAFKVYNLFTQGKYKMTLSDAANSDIWRYLTVELAGDIVIDRWHETGKKIPADHFYEKANRIYLKTLWWYIHLSWQGTEEDTREVLLGNSTDTIINLVERSGRMGYQIDLYRAIMYKFAYPGDGLKAHAPQLFRQVMRLNTARIVNIEPVLCNDGISGYVKGLFNYFSKEKTTRGC